MIPRYAIYFAPAPAATLHALGSGWLGRDAWSGHDLHQPQIANLAQLTAAPRRYGFHATLKAPFGLAPGTGRAELSDFAAEFARQQPPVNLPGLGLACIGGFLALVPEAETDSLRQFAAACVMEFDRFRAALSREEADRRGPNGLTHRQSRLLRNWGYPYVLDQFRFHMTLTGKLGPADFARLKQEALGHFAPVIGQPLTLDAISIFREPHEGAPFLVEERFLLSGKRENAWPETWKLGVR